MAWWDGDMGISVSLSASAYIFFRSSFSLIHFAVLHHCSLPMARPFSRSLRLCSAILFLSIFLAELVAPQPCLSSEEQESVYRVLEGVNSDMPWRSLFSGDLCSSPPHGLVCDYFQEEDGGETVHVTELNIGFVSDFSPNPPCNSNSSISSSVPNLKFLRKLFFYQCFVNVQVHMPSYNLPSSLEELVFIENPSLIGPVEGLVVNYTKLRRMIVTGTRVYGEIPDRIGDLSALEELTLSGNRLVGRIPWSIGKLQNLKILDLNGNRLQGRVPESIGELSRLLKLDLHSNLFRGEIPESIKGLQMLEFIDLGFNRFQNCGIPIFLGEMQCLREIYLSGNRLGGQIPDNWEKLGGVLRIGLSSMGLVGSIPPSMGLFLRNLSYLGLDDNKLDGSLPHEFRLLELSVNELNLENNKLTGMLPFSVEFVSRIGEKLKIAGNPDLCLDEEAISVKNKNSLRHLRICSRLQDPNAAAVLHGGCGVHASNFLLFFVVFLLSLLICNQP